MSGTSGRGRRGDREAARRADGDRRRDRQEQHDYDPTPPGPDDWVSTDDAHLQRVRPPRNLADVLGSFVSDRAWTTRVRQASVLNRWQDVVGETIAQHCRPVKLQGDLLVVAVDSSAWATQLKYLTPRMCEQVNEALGGPVVSRIHLTVDPS